VHLKGKFIFEFVAAATLSMSLAGLCMLLYCKTQSGMSNCRFKVQP